ncbi:MAG: LysM peptidoglycan-binding domain-containing protein [bacterium]
MRNKHFFNAVKCLFYFGCVILIISFSQTFSGCGGADEEETVDQREIDSIDVYSKMQKSFALYKKALEYNHSSDDKNANHTFESALKSLNEINYETITKSQNYFWKIDYDELAKSIIEDYFVTQSELSQSSLIFEFAKRVPVYYDKVEKISGDREPMPEGNDIPLIKNSAVDEYIEFFSNTDRGRSFIDKCLYRSGKYFPIMRKILKFNNAPEELVYLSVQESGLSPTIMSRAGAVGLWQFMPATGYSYGLDQDGYRDDRRDFEKSTDAAARHLKDLYKTYDDWYLAFSAYNAGPGRVNKAISRGGSRDFWSIRGYLPGETKNYVPSIIALSFVLRNPEEYGFKGVEFGAPVSFDRVNIKTPLSLQKIAELCEADIETIRELNSEIINDEVAEYGGNITGVHYTVKNYSPEDKRLIGVMDGRKVVKHEFKKKEMLSVVAVFYEVRPTDIRIWNNLNYGYYPKDKQELSIYLTEEKYKSLYGKNDVKEAEVKEEAPLVIIPEVKSETKTVKKEEPVSEAKVEEEKEIVDPETNIETITTTTANEQETYAETESDEVETVNEPPHETVTSTALKKINTSSKTYTVADGDNLSVIAVKYGVAVDDIKEWNDLETDKIMVGQKLKINPANSKVSIHTVSEGENLTMISNGYGLSLSELKDLNELSTDIIFVGQKLKVTNSKTAKTNNTKTSGVKKTYKVKKGQTIASIAEANEISISDIKKWNNLSNDKIMVGQILKLYEDPSTLKKQKIRKKRN